MLAFLIVVGILIFVHELGHFVAARAFGVKVLRFSIGFGPRIAGFTRGDTEYVIGALPLGGYVLMHGMSPDDDLDPLDRGRSLLDKPLWQRAIVSLAGPLMNLLIAAPAFMVVRAADTERLPPIVGTVADGSPAAAAGLMEGDRIVEIDEQTIRFFSDMQSIVRASPGVALDFVIERDGEQLTVPVTPEAVASRERFLGLGQSAVGQISIMAGRWAPVVHVTPASVAATAGLQTFDEVLSVNGVEVHAYSDLDDVIAAQGPAPLQLRIRRTHRVETGWAAAGEVSFLELTLPGQADFTSFGILPASTSIYAVEPGSPAAQAGLLPGDRIESADGRPVSSLSILLARIQSNETARIEIGVNSGGVSRVVVLTPRDAEVLGEFRTPEQTRFVGIIPWFATRSFVSPEPLHVQGFERFSGAVVDGMSDLVDAVLGIVLGVVFMISGQIDSSNLGGPLLIADVVSRASAAGIITLLGTAALISVNLAILNLLPVPGLDGGTLTLIAFEAVRREPPSPRARQITAFIGVVCIVLLMLFAFKNDLQRYWGDFADYLNS